MAKSNKKSSKELESKGIIAAIKRNPIPVIAIVVAVFVTLAIILSVTLSSSDEPAEDATLSELKYYNGQLIFKMSDGVEVNAGSLPSNHEGIKIISARKIGTVLAGSSGHKEEIEIVCSDSKGADYPVRWYIPKFGSDCSLKSARINSDGELIFTVKENGETKTVNQGKLLKLSTPSSELTPAGASEYAEGELPTDYAEVEIKVKGYGTVTVIIDKSAAPKTAEAFLKLVSEGYYNGLTFNKIFDAETYGDDYSYVLGGLAGKSAGAIENAEEEYSNSISHKYGTISMYHKDGEDATSSFFICTGDNSEALDGKYAAFGYVKSGMNIIEKIAELTGTFSEGDGILSEQLKIYRAKQAVIESITVKV